MGELTSRERVLWTFRFEETDRAPFDLMESIVWPELQKWFADEMGLTDKDAVLDHFGVDFRWFWAAPKPPTGVNLFDPKYMVLGPGGYSDHSVERPLRSARTVAEMLEKHAWRDPAWWDFSGAWTLRERHPDKAIVMLVHQTMLFMTACEFFGIEEALTRLLTDDEAMSAFLDRQRDFSVQSLRRACRETEGIVDICWLMDDVATQRALMMRPDLWRRHFKERLRPQVEIIRAHGQQALFHSCGAIRDILPDLIEIGFNAVLPFQTRAEGMDAEFIAREFGGKIVFYGGMDVQHLLPFGSEADVRREVRKNVDLFAECGGHVVANSHHCISAIQPGNVVAMMDEARKYRPAHSRTGSDSTRRQRALPA